MKRINTPLSEDILEDLRAGDRVFLSGYIYTARDLAHKRIFEEIKNGKPPPFDLTGQVIYYCGPSPQREGKIIGSCGPTTSSRMDPFTPLLLSFGLKGMIGKGKRSKEVKEALTKFKAVYFGAIGGAGAYYSKFVLSCEAFAFRELGPEAIYRLRVKNLPLFVINDIYGGDLYERPTQPISQTL